MALSKNGEKALKEIASFARGLDSIATGVRYKEDSQIADAIEVAITTLEAIKSKLR